jgi:hypothetical protein
VLAGTALAVRAVFPLHPELRGEQGLITSVNERPPDDFLRISVRIDVRRIDQVDAFVKGRENNFPRLFKLHSAAKVVGAKADYTDFQTGVSEVSVFHIVRFSDFATSVNEARL